MKKQAAHAGQAGLIVMLIMVVLLTLGISIATRSTQDVTQSTQEQETSRVFDAAEAGIEQALSGALTASEGTVEDIGDGLSASYTIAEVNSLEVRLDEGHVVAVDLAGYTGNVDVNWSRSSNCASDDPASIEVSIYNSTANTVRRLAYAGCTHASDGFLASAAGSNGYSFAATIAVTANEDLMRIRPVYNDTYLRVTGGVDFPVQYYRINSEATNTISNETRAIQVDRTLPTAPAIFDYVLFSGSGNLSK